MTAEGHKVMLAGVAALTALTTSCAAPVANTGPTPAAAIAELAEGGNALVAVPVTLSGGYEFGGFAGVTDRRGEPVATGWTFVSAAETSAVPVVVCVRLKDAPVDTCPAGHPGTGYERATSRYLVLVSSGDSDRMELPPAWEGVTFTEEWRNLPWVSGRAEE